MIWLWMAAGVVLITALIVGRLSWRNAEETGLPMARVSVVYSDSGAWESVAEPLFSPRYALTGKPDYILQTRQGLVPIELKPLRQANQPYESDILQLAAYCLLLEEAWEETPPYGLLRYRDQTFRIEWTDDLREELLATLDEMRELEGFKAERGGPLPTPQHDMTTRCQACGFHYVCWPD